MVLRAPIGSTLEVSIGIFIGLVLENYFGTWKGSLFGVSLVELGGLMIGNRKGSLVGLSLVLPLGFPLGMYIEN